MQPRVLVGCPTYSGKKYALPRFVAALKKLDYPTYDILLVDNSEGDEYKKELEKLGIPVVKGPSTGDPMERITKSRNILRDKFIEGKYDFLLSLEQDVTPPPDAIGKLMSRGVAVVSGLYANFFQDNFGKPTAHPVAYAKVTEEQFNILKTDPKYKGTEIRKKIESGVIKGPEDIHVQLSVADVTQERLIEVFFTGLGCMLIHKSVLEKIPFRASKTSFDDYTFCMDAYNAGYPIWLDTSVKCGHLIDTSVKKDAD